VTTATTTADVTGMVVTAVVSKTITATATPAPAWMRNTFTIPSVKKIVQSIHGRAMDIVTTPTMYAAVTGTAVTVVVTAIKDTSTITVRSVSAWTLH